MSSRCPWYVLAVFLCFFRFLLTCLPEPHRTKKTPILHHCEQRIMTVQKRKETPLTRAVRDSEKLLKASRVRHALVVEILLLSGP